LYKYFFIQHPNNILSSPIEYLTGVSTLKGDLLRKEINVFTFKDLLEYFPFRHIDKTKIDLINSLHEGMDYVQVAGRVVEKKIIGERRAKRLIVHLQDETGLIELVWFQGINFVEKILTTGQAYLVFGKISFFMGKPQIAHPEIEVYNSQNSKGKSFLEPIYPSTEKLKARGLNGRQIAKLTQELIKKISTKDVPENLPHNLMLQFKLMGRFDAFTQIHLPANEINYQQAVRRLKFEEFFLAQMSIQKLKLNRHKNSRGLVFEKVGNYFNEFYEKYLPFSLTNAQKNVLKEIRKDFGSGKQMNRLLQGDVGSGKTMVALLSMLIAADNDFQAVLMAPTEILAQQHFNTITSLLNEMNIEVQLLTGSTKLKNRKKILLGCENGEVKILIGTHAVIEDNVVFKNLGFAVVDEQHKFGVAQRAKLWKKNDVAPHVLVMTATPIPRTLALTVYGDLDYSIIDELPPGRKPISTIHRFENKRSQVMDFIKEQITLGRQAYVIYPLIEESSKLDYENLMKGYEEVKSFFPEPKYWISMVHGKQTAEIKENNMQRFVNADTQILVGTTVIEVGVNVPNASVMVIESAEKFGLSQLHQLRGRVGRGADQSYCVLLTGQKLSKDAKERLRTMVETSDGFKIAEKDLEIRGPGEIEGTRQSGALSFKLANIVDDRPMLEVARNVVAEILEKDADLELPDNQPLKTYLLSIKSKTRWGKIA